MLTRENMWKFCSMAVSPLEARYPTSCWRSPGWSCRTLGRETSTFSTKCVLELTRVWRKPVVLLIQSTTATSTWLMWVVFSYNYVVILEILFSPQLRGPMTHLTGLRYWRPWRQSTCLRTSSMTSSRPQQPSFTLATSPSWKREWRLLYQEIQTVSSAWWNFIF